MLHYLPLVTLWQLSLHTMLRVNDRASTQVVNWLSEVQRVHLFAFHGLVMYWAQGVAYALIHSSRVSRTPITCLQDSETSSRHHRDICKIVVDTSYIDFIVYTCISWNRH